jgi:type I restriction enzyme, S subunit
MAEVILPEGWINTNLGSIIELKYGKSLPEKNRDYGEYPVYGSNGIVGKHSVPLVSTPGLIVGRKGSYGEVQFSETPFFPIDTTYFVDELYDQPLNYWFYQLKYLPLTELNRSTAIPGLNREDAYKQGIFLLPLAEQKVIADKLDTLLAQVESTKARLERIPQILKRFRQSVLAAAVSGKLTEEWRDNLEYYQVPQSHDWKWGQVPQLWETDSFPNLVSSRLGKMLDKAKNTGKPTKYIGNINVRWFSFDLENLQKILVSEEEQNELGVKRGDVLICEGGEPGRCAIWSEDTTYPIVFQKALHRVRVGKRITPQWLAFNLKNDSDNKSLEQLFTGTTIKHLTGKALNKYPLRVPPVEEQTEIVRRVEQLFAYADTIEQQVQNALTRVNNLTQSILAKAFRGELTEQWRKDNPDLISGDNSAEVLLAKIKAERDKLKPVKKRARSRVIQHEN